MSLGDLQMHLKIFIKCPFDKSSGTLYTRNNVAESDLSYKHDGKWNIIACSRIMIINMYS